MPARTFAFLAGSVGGKVPYLWRWGETAAQSETTERERGFGRTGMAPTQERKCPLSGRSQKASLSDSGRPHPKYLKRETGFTLRGSA